MNAIEAINSRCSIRHFTGAPVDDSLIDEILEAGRQAPSGLNNQPWRFVVIRDVETRNTIAGFSKYGRAMREADVLVAVFFDPAEGYHRDKDMQSIGACIQSMWLAAHSLGVGMCWIGEIIARGEDVGKAVGVAPGIELSAILCFGHPDPEKSKKTDRLPLDKLVIARL